MFLLSMVYFPKWNLPVKFFMLLLLPIQDVITVFQISSGWGNLFGQLFSITHKKQWSWAPDWPNKNIQYSWNPEGINHKLLLFCCCCLHSHVFHCERSAQFGSSVMSDILWPPHGLQHGRFPCTSPTPRVCSNLCPSNQWCHPATSSSVMPFSSCLQSFTTSGSFPWVSSSHQVAKVLKLQVQHRSFKWIFRTDFL